jgi:hypothetical protein
MKCLLLATGLGIPYLRKKNSLLNLKGIDKKRGAYMTSSLKSIKTKLVFRCHISKIKFLLHV